MKYTKTAFSVAFYLFCVYYTRKRNIWFTFSFIWQESNIIIHKLRRCI